MGDLVSKSLNTQSDPALVLQQALANREKQYSGIANPQQQLAARLGGLLGGGLVNVAQDRNFFDINDPLLNRVTQIQGVYNDVASRVDPTVDPAKFYSELQSAYSAAGLGREALAASEEARKAKAAGLDIQIKEGELYKQSPELLVGKINEALTSGNEAEATRLANLKTRLDKQQELSIRKTEADIESSLASAGYHRAGIEKIKADVAAGKVDVKPVTDLTGMVVGYTFLDKTNQKTNYVPLDEETLKQQRAAMSSGKKPTEGGNKPEGKLDVNKYMQDGQSTTRNTQGEVVQTPKQETTWSGVPVNPKPVVPPTPMQERDYAIQRSMPNVNVSLLTEAQKALLAQQLGL